MQLGLNQKLYDDLLSSPKKVGKVAALVLYHLRFSSPHLTSCHTIIFEKHSCYVWNNNLKQSRCLCCHHLLTAICTNVHTTNVAVIFSSALALTHVDLCSFTVCRFSSILDLILEVSSTFILVGHSDWYRQYG